MRAAIPTGSLDAQGNLLLTVTFCVALLVRLIVIGNTIGFQTPAALEPAADSRIHIMLVENLLAGRGYSLGEPTGITPPLYIFALAGLYRVFGDPGPVRLVQAALASVGCVMLFVVGRKLYDPTVGLVAAGILSFYPLTAYLAGLHLTENLFLVLLLAILWQALRVEDAPRTPTAAGLGVLIGLAILTRAIFLTFLPFVGLWACAVWGARDPRARRVLAVVLATAALVVIPWTLRNYLVLGSLVPVQSNSGMVFWAGNNPQADGGMVWPTSRTWTATRPPDDNLYGWRDLSVGQENALYIQTALRWIRGHPLDYLRLLPQKLGRLYGFARAVDAQAPRVPVTLRGVHAAVLLLAVAGVVQSRRDWPRLLLPLSLIAFVNGTTLLFSGATRYIVPMAPSLALFSAIMLMALFHRVRSV